MIANGGSVEEDEAFARRLQQEEFNNSRLVSLFSQANRLQAGQNRDDSINSEAPLLVGNVQQPMGPMAPNEQQRQGVRNVQNNIQLIQGLEQARNSSPRIVLCVVIFGLVECITTATIITTNIGNDCGSAGGLSIEWWLLLFSLRHIVGIPIMIWDYKLNLLQESPAIQRRRLTLKKLQNWVKIGTFVWWIFGQFLLYDPKSVASEQCPSLYYYCIAVIVCTYLGISLPLLCLVGLCVCYPCIAALLHYLNNQSASGNTIEENTVMFKYDGVASVRAKIQENYPATQTQLNEDEDPQCSICFCEYEKDEDVRLLPCGHLYHKDCVDTWLGSHKRTCPQCRHDITRRVNAAEAAV